jgi:hypothetical protein
MLHLLLLSRAAFWRLGEHAAHTALPVAAPTVAVVEEYAYVTHTSSSK